MINFGNNKLALFMLHVGSSSKASLDVIYWTPIGKNFHWKFPNHGNICFHFYTPTHMHYSLHARSVHRSYDETAQIWACTSRCNQTYDISSRDRTVKEEKINQFFRSRVQDQQSGRKFYSDMMRSRENWRTYSKPLPRASFSPLISWDPMNNMHPLVIAFSLCSGIRNRACSRISRAFE